MIEIYSPNNDNLGIVYRKAGVLSIVEEIHLPSGDTLSTAIVSASHAAGVILQMTGDLYSASEVQDMLSENINYHFPVKESA